MNKQCFPVLNEDSVLLCGYYKKLKTMKKKYFVLYTDSAYKNARLEYYDSEKKFKSGFTPKRIIKIKNCFDINRRLYSKHKFVIVLASKEGGFGIVLESEHDTNTWLNHLWHLQRSGECGLDVPQYDVVWQVIIQKKGIADQHSMYGSHHICLSNNSITFIKIGREKNASEKRTAKMEVLLTTIRRCGDSQCFFYMEIGRQSSLGPGELWMETEDSLTAKNMHEMILNKMVSLNEALVEPMRKRSSSATESSNLQHDRKSSQAFDVTSNFSAQNFRDRCDSLPARNRTSSECSNRIVRMTPNIAGNRTVNFHANKTSPITFSASEESVSVDESEESIGVPYLIRSPECVIPEEYSNDTPKYQYTKKNTDINSVTTASMGSVTKANLPLMKPSSTAFAIDRNKDICGNIDDEVHIPFQPHYTMNKWENDVRKDATTNRVRAFSVGSRVKSTRICSKASPKLFNSDSVDCSTKKSLSVPVLVNKNLQLRDQMGDLMEIDFSKPSGKSLNRNFHLNINECQNAFYVQRKKFTFSNSEESIQKNMKKSDNGYLEMRPITLESNCATSNGNTDANISRVQPQSQDIIEEKELKEGSLANSTEKIHDRKSVASLNDSDNSQQNSLNATDKDAKIKSPSPTSVNNPTLSSTCSLKSNQSDESSITKDLYYASLDLPKCSDDADVHYTYQESSSDTSCEELKNEYAKINFIQSDTTQSFTVNK